MDHTNIKKPTRISKVPLDECLSVLREYLDRLPNDRKSLPGPLQPIWVEISKRFSGKWNARDVYRECKEDRRQVWTILHSVNAPNDSLNETTDSSCLINSTLNSTTDDDDNDKDEDWMWPQLNEYEIKLSEEMYKMLCENDPVNYKGHSCRILRRWGWTDYIAEEFFKATESRCAFVFKNAKLYNSPSANYHMMIRGQCKSEKCKNQFYGFMDSKPEHFPAILHIKTKDTVFDVDHEDVRRPVRKDKRARIGQEAAAMGPSNWLKNQLCRSETQRIPPTIPSAAVIRKCVNEFRDKNLGVKKGDKIDVIKTIENMRYSNEYNNFIRDIKKDKFYVFYSSNVQLHAYKRYHHLMKIKKQKSTVAVDGTGSLCKKILFDNGRTSGHIFLYAMVINFDHFTLSVHQLLTDDQSTTLLEYWIKNWIRMGAPKPDQVACDHSRALINALSLAFNEQNIKVYIETLFLNAIGDSSAKIRPPIATFIRLDVAHFIKMITNWQSVKSIENNAIRKFYIFCIALLIDAQNINEFEMILKNIFIVCNNEYQDTVLRNGKSVLEIRKELELLISDRKYNVNNDEKSTTSEETEKVIDDRVNYPEHSSIIQKWIDNIILSTKKIDEEGVDPNGFSNKRFMNDFVKLIAPTFPLWSAACLPGEVEHATTSYVESYFNDKKHRVLADYKNPIRVDKFLKIEHKDLQGGSALLNSNLLNDFQKKRIKQDDAEASSTIQTDVCLNEDAYSYDNWRNKGKKEINDFTKPIEEETVRDKIPTKNAQQKLGFYFQDQPSISFINDNADSKITLKKMNVLENGNSLRAALINHVHYYIQNTCSFDSIVQILSTTAVDDPSYYAFAELSQADVMKFIINFIKTAKMDSVYKERAKLIINKFPEKIQEDPADGKCSLLPRIVNMFSTSVEVWSKCFNDVPSGFDNYDCDYCGKYTKNVPIICLKEQKKICEEGYQALGKHLQQLSITSQSMCHRCGRICNINRVYNHHVYVELELQKNLKSPLMTCKLSDFERNIEFSARHNTFR